MRWLRHMLGNKQVEHDPARQEAMRQDVRQRFGAHVQVPPAEQVDALIRLLDGDDGLTVAMGIVHQFAEEAHTDLLGQVYEVHRRTGRRFLVDRRNYRPLWKAAGPELRWPLFALPSGLHPYVQLTAAATVVGAGAPRLVRLGDPNPLLAHVFELFDLTTAGWEWGRVRVDAHAATLAMRLVSAARQIRLAMDEDPPPLPPPVRELMRRNNTIAVHDPNADRVLGGINLGGELRPALLV